MGVVFPEAVLGMPGLDAGTLPITAAASSPALEAEGRLSFQGLSHQSILKDGEAEPDDWDRTSSDPFQILASPFSKGLKAPSRLWFC